MKPVILFLLLLISLHIKAQSDISWPGGKKAAIVLTYDDALSSQLHIAIPQLDSLHLKGTFFLTGNLNPASIEQWRTASRNGHELGNHTLYHPCLSTAYKAHPNYTSENYDVYIILREIAMMNNLLYAIDGKSSRTYAYPCTETKVGGKDYTDSLAKSGLIKYARIGGDSNSVITQFKSLNFYQVPSWGFGNHPDSKALIAFVKKVQQAKGLGIFMFHGVGGDYLEVSAEDHKQLLQYLAAHTDIWIAPFQQVMDYIKNADNKLQ